MTPADYAWPDDDLRARLEIAEASVHVLTELIYRVAGILTPDQIAILGLPGGICGPMRVGSVSSISQGGARP